MFKQKLRRIVAKEGLIILGLGIALYLILTIMPHPAFTFLKYKLELGNGDSYVVTISPELSDNYDKKRVIAESFHPSPQLIIKRLNEFMRDNNINQEIKNSYPINSKEIALQSFAVSLLTLNFFIQLAIMYSILLLTRFIVWAVNTLRREE